MQDWTNSDEFFHNDVRTTRTVDSNFKPPVHTKKERLKVVDVACDRSQVPASSPSSHWPDIRVSLCSETPVDDSSLPPITTTHLVRIKQRRSYCYKVLNDNLPAVWTFSLTRCWAAPSRSEAEQKMRDNCSSYEIELECSNPSAVLADQSHDDTYVARSLLYKMNDFYLPSGRKVLAVHRHLPYVQYELNTV